MHPIRFRYFVEGCHSPPNVIVCVLCLVLAPSHGWGNDEDEMNAVAEAAHMPYTGEGLTWRRDRSGAHDDDAAAVVDLTDGEQQQASASSTASTGSTQSLTTTAGAGAGATEIAASSGPPGSRRARRLARKRARQEAAREAEASASSEGGTAGGGGAGGGAGAGAGTAASSSASASSSTAAAAGAGKQKAPRKRQRVAKAADGSLPGQDGNLLMHNGEIIAQLVKQLRCSICLGMLLEVCVCT